MAMTIDSMRWKARFPNASIKVEVAYAEIMRIKAKNGGVVSPDALVVAAAKKYNPLHRLFTWDDTEAAKKFRLQEAGALLRSIEITYANMPAQPRRAFEVTQKKASGSVEKQTLYATAEEVATDPAAHAALISEAVRSLMTWRARFCYLQELSQLLAAIDRTLVDLVK